jgi:hypothetical protein
MLTPSDGRRHSPRARRLRGWPRQLKRRLCLASRSVWASAVGSAAERVRTAATNGVAGTGSRHARPASDASSGPTA